MSETVQKNDAFQLATVLAAAGRNAREIAAAVGVCEKTIRRWSKRETFRRTVDSLRADLLVAAVGRLYTLMGDAADALARLLESDNEQIKLSAASRIISLSLRSNDAEMRQILDEMKRYHDQKKQP